MSTHWTINSVVHVMVALVKLKGFFAALTARLNNSYIHVRSALVNRIGLSDCEFLLLLIFGEKPSRIKMTRHASWLGICHPNIFKDLRIVNGQVPSTLYKNFTFTIDV